MGLRRIGLGFGARGVVLWHGGLGLMFGAVVWELGGVAGGGFGLARGGFVLGTICLGCDCWVCEWGPAWVCGL